MRSTGLSNGADTPRPDDRRDGGTGWQPGHQPHEPVPGSDGDAPRTAPQPILGQDPRAGQQHPEQQGSDQRQTAGPYSSGSQDSGSSTRPQAEASSAGPYGQPEPHSPYSQPPQAAGSQAGSGFGPGHQAGGTDARTRRRGGAGLIAGGLILSALVGAGTYAAVDTVAGSDAASTAAASRELIVNDTDSVTEITGAAAKASPSVVTISSSDGQSAGSGSGIILDEEGHILTNTHVVTMDGQSSDPSIEVQLSDGTVTTAEVVGTDPLSDLAVIKIDEDGLVPAELGSSSDLNVGDTAIAIGAPLGLSGTVTDGIISTTDRTIAVASSAVPEIPDEGESSEEDQGGGGWQDFFFDYGQGDSSQGQTESVFLNVIQTDASINPGNSGGALVDVDGKVVGINVAIASASGEESAGAGSIGVGFAIPIDQAERIAQEIIDTGEATHGYLGAGVSAAAADDGESRTFSEGALVRSVEDGSPADDAGLQEGDIIRSFNGHTTLDADELTAAVREVPAGGKGELVYERNGQEKTVEVTVGNAADAD